MSDISLGTIIALIQALGGGGGGGGGTTNYNSLSNKPQIGGVTLQGDKSLPDLGIQNVEVVRLA